MKIRVELSRSSMDGTYYSGGVWAESGKFLGMVRYQSAEPITEGSEENKMLVMHLDIESQRKEPN